MFDVEIILAVIVETSDILLINDTSIREWTRNIN